MKVLKKILQNCQMIVLIIINQKKIDKVIENYNINDEEILNNLSFKVNNTPIEVTLEETHYLYNIEQTFKLKQINSSPIIKNIINYKSQIY